MVRSGVEDTSREVFPRVHGTEALVRRWICINWHPPYSTSSELADRERDPEAPPEVTLRGWVLESGAVTEASRTLSEVTPTPLGSR
jgi:hypothetical protein